MTTAGRALPRRALLRTAAAAALVLGAGRAAGAARPTITVYKSPT